LSAQQQRRQRHAARWPDDAHHAVSGEQFEDNNGERGINSGQAE
jgi:hypothetical protein